MSELSRTKLENVLIASVAIVIPDLNVSTLPAVSTWFVSSPRLVLTASTASLTGGAISLKPVLNASTYGANNVLAVSNVVFIKLKKDLIVSLLALIKPVIFLALSSIAFADLVPAFEIIVAMSNPNNCLDALSNSPKAFSSPFFTRVPKFVNAVPIPPVAVFATSAKPFTPPLSSMNLSFNCSSVILPPFNS